MIIENHGNLDATFYFSGPEVIILPPKKAVYISEEEDFSCNEDLEYFVNHVQKEEGLKIVGDRKVYNIGENIPRKIEKLEKIKEMKKSKFEMLDI